MSDVTMYSAEIPGEYGNFKHSVRFDKSGRQGHKGGYIGISQTDSIDGHVARVLLSPKQVKALVEFLGKPIRQDMR